MSSKNKLKNNGALTYLAFVFGTDLSTFYQSLPLFHIESIKSGIYIAKQ